MASIKIQKYSKILLVLHATTSNAYEENSKFLGNPEERHFGKRKRPSTSAGSNPCNFGNGYRRPKNQGTGRTFFDLQFLNVEHNYNLEINCGGSAGSYPHPAPVTEIHNENTGGGLGNQHGGGNKPLKPFQGHKPHRPPKPGGGGFFQGLFGGDNKPHVGDAQPQSGQGLFADFFPSPQQFATGLSEGFQSFIGTLPDIGQSFQSILPSFDNFQWPQLPNFQLPNFQGPQLPQFIQGGPDGPGTGPVLFGPVFPQGNPVSSNPFNRPPSFSTPGTTLPPVVSNTPPFVTPSIPTTTTDPDDIIYNDEIKPVNEDYDPITDPYSNRPSDNLLPGQYLVISNPHLGSYTQDLSPLKPNNIYKWWTQGVQEVLDELGDVNAKYGTNSYYLRRRADQYRNSGKPFYAYNGRNQNQENSRFSSFSQRRPEGRSFSFPS